MTVDTTACASLGTDGNSAAGGQLPICGLETHSSALEKWEEGAQLLLLVKRRIGIEEDSQ